MKITQKMMAFYMLWREYRYGDRERYIPTWCFVGEMEIPELKTHVMMSYKCPTRLTDIFQQNPGLLDRKLLHGKSGATYYGYRIAPGVRRRELLQDTALLAFYDRLKKGMRELE